MTLNELILYYNGIGYRKSCVVRHRGSSKDGHTNAGYFYNEYLQGNKHWLLGYPIIDMYDIRANDWIGKPSNNKLLNLIND